MAETCRLVYQNEIEKFLACILGRYHDLLSSECPIEMSFSYRIAEHLHIVFLHF